MHACPKCGEPIRIEDDAVTVNGVPTHRHCYEADQLEPDMLDEDDVE